MDFGFNDEQRAIKETAREMLASRSPLSAVRAAAESRTYDDALWKEICELGWPGIAIAGTSIRSPVGGKAGSATVGE